MTTSRRRSKILLLFALFCFLRVPALAQAGFDDDRVMLQGFYWESHWHGHPEKFPALGSKVWCGLGMIGDTTDGIAWKQRSVTFVENHDTGFRTEENGRPEQGHELDSFANGREVEQAYAYVLTHPGVPCVYWKHVFDWGPDLRSKIRALINARKVAGVHGGSALRLQNNARARGVYAARVEGGKGPLYVRIGGSDADWQPSASGYSGYREYARGADWKVWVGLPNNPAVRQAPLKAAFPIPTFKPIEQIQVPDAWLNG